MEFPYIQKIYEELENSGFTVIALEVRGDRKGAQDFIDEKGITFKIITDHGASVASELFGVYAYPTSFIIDREGVIRYRHIGFKPGMEANLRAEIAPLLG